MIQSNDVYLFSHIATRNIFFLYNKFTMENYLGNTYSCLVREKSQTICVTQFKNGNHWIDRYLIAEKYVLTHQQPCIILSLCIHMKYINISFKNYHWPKTDVVNRKGEIGKKLVQIQPQRLVWRSQNTGFYFIRKTSRMWKENDLIIGTCSQFWLCRN